MGNAPTGEWTITTIILLSSLEDKSDYCSLPKGHLFCFSLRKQEQGSASSQLSFLNLVACFILGNALLAIIKDYTIQHFRLCNGLPPSSFCKLHISGGRKDLCSHLHFKTMKRRNPLKLSFKVKLVNGRAGPRAQAS